MSRPRPKSVEATAAKSRAHVGADRLPCTPSGASGEPPATIPGSRPEMVFSEPAYDQLIDFLVDEAIRAWRASNTD